MRLKEDYPRLLVELAQKADQYMKDCDYEMCNSLVAEINCTSGRLYLKLKKIIEIEQHKQTIRNLRKSKLYVG